MRGGLSPTLSKGEGAISRACGSELSDKFLCQAGTQSPVFNYCHWCRVDSLVGSGASGTTYFPEGG